MKIKPTKDLIRGIFLGAKAIREDHNIEWFDEGDYFDMKIINPYPVNADRIVDAVLVMKQTFMPEPRELIIMVFADYIDIKIANPEAEEDI